MAKVLMTWELGSGLGHVGPLRAIGSELVRRGHAVTLATPAANLPLCRQALAGTGMAIQPAPTLPPSPMLLKYPCTYADTLHDGGYSSAEKVTTAVATWLTLFDDTQPDLLLAEFSPTPLLASRLRSFATASLGTGFDATHASQHCLSRGILSPTVKRRETRVFFLPVAYYF